MRGTPIEPGGNAGRYDVLVAGSVAWRATDRLAITADVKAPIYSHVTGSQLDYGIVADAIPPVRGCDARWL